MKTWRDELHPASFRGVPFHVDSDSMPIGRRTQLHEYPQRDKPLVEDMGRVTREIKLTAFVVGDDCYVQRDNLLNALDQPGAGELIHPWYGRLMATATPCSVSHERREGGVVRFDLTFIEDGEKGFPAGVPNTARKLEESSETLLQSAIRRYKAAMAVVNRVRVSVLALQNAVAGIQMAIYQEFAQLTGLISSVESLADMLVNSPGNFAAMFRAQFADFTGHNRSSGYNWGATSSSSDLELEADPEFARTVAGVPAVEPEFTGFVPAARDIAGKVEAAQVLVAALAADRAASNAAGGLATVAVAQAARELVRDVLIVYAVRVAATMPAVKSPVGLPGTPTLEQQVSAPVDRPEVPVTADVVAIRDALDAMLWDAAQDVPHQHFEVLEVVRKAMRGHLTEVARAGVRLTQVTTHESLPAVVLAYQCYGDASRAAEIVTRNKVSHPGFLPVGALSIAQE